MVKSADPKRGPSYVVRTSAVSTVPLGDAMVTAVPGIALGILTADCAPVLFADGDARHLYAQYGFVEAGPVSVGMDYTVRR